LAKTIATNAPSNGAYQWQVGFDLTPAGNYTIKISSNTNAALSTVSAGAFSVIDAPAVTAGSVVRLPDGRVQFSVSAPGANQISVLGSSDLVTWQLLQSLPVTSGSAVFIDSTAANDADRFYRLRVP